MPLEFKASESTPHGLVLAIGNPWHKDASQNCLMLSAPRRKRVWFSGLWARFHSSRRSRLVKV